MMVQPNATAATVMQRNISSAIGAIPLGVTDQELQQAASGMISSRVLHMGPLVPGVFRSFVGRNETVWVNAQLQVGGRASLSCLCLLGTYMPLTHRPCFFCCLACSIRTEARLQIPSAYCGFAGK